MKFVILTGMSGAGKSTAIKMMEDIGYYCVDNLPNGQQVNQVIADAAANVRTGWQFPPFFEWMRNDWTDEATPFFTSGEGDLKTVFENWQKSSIDYGNEQGFTVE